jgi:hypothetical protein
LQSVENQGVDAWVGFIIACFLQNGTKLQSHSKATPKQQIVENQALERFFWSKAKSLKIKHLKVSESP